MLFFFSSFFSTREMSLLSKIQTSAPFALFILRVPVGKMVHVGATKKMPVSCVRNVKTCTLLSQGVKFG